MTQRLAQRSRALHGHQVRKVFHVSALVFCVKEIIGRRQCHQIRPGFSKCHLYQSHVQMRTMISSHDKIRVIRDVGLPFIVGAQ